MQRLTARLLLLFALAGNFLPVALAATAAPSHACCVRKAHKCHEAAGTDAEKSFTARNCCANHECCRALTRTQSAPALSPIAPVFTVSVETHASERQASAAAARIAASQSPRAPPTLSV